MKNIFFLTMYVLQTAFRQNTFIVLYVWKLFLLDGNSSLPSKFSFLLKSEMSIRLSDCDNLIGEPLHVLDPSKFLKPVPFFLTTQRLCTVSGSYELCMSY